MKKVLFFILFLATASSVITAQDIIEVTWEPSFWIPHRAVDISATAGKEFTVDWGDGVIETKTGEGSDTITLYHKYLTAGNYTATIAASDTDCRFTYFDCSHFLVRGLVVRDCSALEVLYCNNNEITNLEVIGCTSLQKLDCSLNKLTDLDAGGCPNLQYLICHRNSLGNLDITNCTNLIELSCYQNKIKSLNVSNCPALQVLSCGYNQITSLDVSNCPDMRSLSCNSNQLTSLNITGCMNLYYLGCFSNQITNLDVSGRSNLWRLDCENNQLTTLSITGCSDLQHLSCSSNKLTTLDLSDCPNLEWLNCGNNQLTKLDVVGHTALWYLMCYSNQLTKLDLNSCASLQDLSCRYNRLQLSDLFAAHLLIEDTDNKYLGPQNLLSQTVSVGDELFSEQSVFDGIFTKYIITINGELAPQSNYNVIDGRLIFNVVGEYTATMTNDAIVSSPYHPAEVIVDIEVSEVGIEEWRMENGEWRIYPNPTDGKLTITGYRHSVLDTESPANMEGLRVEPAMTITNMEVFDLMGRAMTIVETDNYPSLRYTTLNISHLPAGMYFVRITTDSGTVTKKIIKN